MSLQTIERDEIQALPMDIHVFKHIYFKSCDNRGQRQQSQDLFHSLENKSRSLTQCCNDRVRTPRQV